MRVTKTISAPEKPDPQWQNPEIVRKAKRAVSGCMIALILMFGGLAFIVRSAAEGGHRAHLFSQVRQLEKSLAIYLQDSDGKFPDVGGDATELKNILGHEQFLTNEGDELKVNPKVSGQSTSSLSAREWILQGTESNAQVTLFADGRMEELNMRSGKKQILDPMEKGLVSITKNE